MSEYDYESALWFCSVVTDSKIRKRLLAAFGTPEGVRSADEDALVSEGGLKEDSASLLCSSKADNRIGDILRKLDQANARFLWHEDSRFPKCLLAIDDAPLGLFVQGTLPAQSLPAVAVIGTRQSSAYGESVARQLGRSLGDSGVVVVSGLAMGIDAAAHQGCLEANGTTVAVLGSGIGSAYPRENEILYRRIVKDGCVISEYAPGIPAMKHHFPHRNRLIAGLCDGVAVVEAKNRSGTLITVDRALEQGKSVYAVPGRITDRNSDGCNHLIREGAMLITGPGEILADLASTYGLMVTDGCDGHRVLAGTESSECPIDSSKNSKKRKMALESEEKIVYAFLRLSPKHFDQLVWESGMTPRELAQILGSLERSGWIEKAAGGWYRCSE